MTIAENFEDVKFAVNLLDPEFEIDIHENDTLLTHILNTFQPNKSLKDLKKVRNGLDQQPCEKQLLSLISYYNHYKTLLTTSNLKNIKYLESFNLDLDYLYFYLLDIRVGLVIDAKEAEGSEKLFIETVDFGHKKLQIVSGVRPYISKEEFIGKKYLFLTNIKKSKIMGIESHGMILCGKDSDVKLIRVGDDVPVGTRLTLESPCIVSEYENSKIDLKKAFFGDIFSQLKIVNGHIEFMNVKACLNSVPFVTEIENGTIS